MWLSNARRTRRLPDRDREPELQGSEPWRACLHTSKARPGESNGVQETAGHPIHPYSPSTAQGQTNPRESDLRFRQEEGRDETFRRFLPLKQWKRPADSASFGLPHRANRVLYAMLLHEAGYVYPTRSDRAAMWATMPKPLRSELQGAGCIHRITRRGPDRSGPR